MLPWESTGQAEVYAWTRYFRPSAAGRQWPAT
ncbi:hypothetical protein [uncultured Sphingomonas sp.]